MYLISIQCFLIFFIKVFKVTLESFHNFDIYSSKLFVFKKLSRGLFIN